MGVWRDYWWLVFPLAAALGSGWYHWVSYQRAKAVLETLRAFADAGAEPPEQLLNSLSGPSDPGWSMIGLTAIRGSFGTARRIVIWAALACGFGAGSLTVRSAETAEMLRVLAIVFAVLTAATAAWVMTRGRDGER
jgi:hypothetical protein